MILTNYTNQSNLREPMKKLCYLLLRLFGWKTDTKIPDVKKAVMCVAPHTSNWDFIIGELFYTSLGGKASFLIKEEWLKPPFGFIFKKLGGIGVNRSKSNSLTESLAQIFKEKEEFHLAITPEGTRKRSEKWKLGFYHIAKKAGVPIILVTIDYKYKEAKFMTIFYPTDNEEEDINNIKRFYEGANGKFPERFSLGKNYQPK